MVLFSFMKTLSLSLSHLGGFLSAILSMGVFPKHSHTSTRMMPKTPRKSPAMPFGPRDSRKKRLARTATVSGKQLRPSP